MATADCPTCQHLAAELERAERIYAEKRGEFRIKRETASAALYRFLHSVAEEARQEFESARDERDRHLASHAVPV